MPAFLNDITPFIGTGEKNEQGLGLKEFLDEYDSKKYECPCVTADILVMRHPRDFHTVREGIKLLMIKRRNHPGIGMWALPGGFVEIREDLIDSAKRELKEETNLEGIPMEQLFTWGDYDRDPRCRIITTAFLALVEEDIQGMKAGDDAADAAWMDVELVQEAEEIVQEGDRERVRTIYSLKLNGPRGVPALTARTAYTVNRHGLLKEPHYEVLDREGIAFDHPCMIVQALLHIQRLLERK